MEKRSLPVGTFLQNAKYVPIRTYQCSFQQKLTLETAKQQALLIVFIHSYDYRLRLWINKDFLSRLLEIIT